jgi:ATP-dependent Clp protease adaptor protein ClpS
MRTMPAAPMVDVETTPRTGLAPRWHVVLLNDDDHTYDYVVELLVRIFAMTPERALRHACEVDAAGRTIVDTTSRERAELKVEQIHAAGPDHRLPRSRGSMSAEMEPAE